MLDGTPEDRSAATRLPYADDPTTSGQMDFPPEELRAILREAQQRNVQLLLHTIGDRTTETLLNAMEGTGGPGSWSQKRLRIEHGEGVMPDLVPRAKVLGVIVVGNPSNFGLANYCNNGMGTRRPASMRRFVLSCWLAYHWRLLLTLRRSHPSQTRTYTSCTPARIPGDPRSR